MIKSLILKLHKDEEGGDTISFVLLLPCYIFIFAMIVTISQLFYASTVSLNAANAGVRAAVIQESSSKARSACDEAVSEYIGKAGMGVTLDGSPTLNTGGSWTRGHICTCVVKVHIRTLLPIPFYGGFDRGYTVQKACPMMIERDRL